MNSRFSAVFVALTAAALFGAATPLAKALLGSMSAFIVAGLFYLGSGVGLGIGILVRRLRQSPQSATANHRIPRAELSWLMGAILAGGVVGPALLMLGLSSTSAASSSLLLNLESVLTAAIAWVVFRENVDIQVFLGMVAIVAGGVLLSWHPGQVAVPVGALLIVGACACWAVDNNLTRKVSANDAMVIACLKGLIAGPVNLTIAFATGAALPAASVVGAGMLTGLAGYGVSLVLFIVALRHLGTARTGAYFSVAPLFGVALSLAIWPEPPSVFFWGAAALMALGVWLRLCASGMSILTSFSNTPIGIATMSIISMSTTFRMRAMSRIPTRMLICPLRTRTRIFPTSTTAIGTRGVNSKHRLVGRVVGRRQPPRWNPYPARLSGRHLSPSLRQK